MESPTLNLRANFKAHKQLPKRRVVSSDPIPEFNDTSPRRKRSASESHRIEISSWIESASPTLSSAGQRLPLTPPVLPEDSLEATLGEPIEPEVLDDERLADNATPVGQSPLTPDLTPPRMSFRDSSHQRYPSSAAESFKTAREFATSEDSFHRFSSPESDLSTVIQETSRPNTLIPNGTNPLSIYAKNIGLGLTLDSKRGSHATIVPATPEIVSNVVEDPFIVKETAAVQHVAADRTGHQPSVMEDEFELDSIPQKVDDFSTTREGSLLLNKRIVSDRLESHRRSLRNSLPDGDEARNSTESTSPSPQDQHQVDDEEADINELPLLIKVDTETVVHVDDGDSPILDPTVKIVDQQDPVSSIEFRSPPKQRRKRSSEELAVQRLSHVSTKSADVIEAIVISPPRQRRHKLRRSSKNHCLRNVSSPTNDSNNSSVHSAQQIPALRHKSATLPEKNNRVSLNSDSGISMGNEALNNKDNQLPSFEIPPRQSSLRGQRKKLFITTPEKETRKSRPMTAPERLMSPTGEIMSQMHPIFDIRPHSLRRSSEPRGREVRHAPPVFIPPRSSSLSAPTSQNNSRTASMTSDARKPQDQQRTPNPHRSSSPRVRISLPEQEAVLIKTHTEGIADPFRSGDEDSMASPYLRSSLTRTPFSAISTPGIVEYGQGTSMPIYPHNNESLLVVQHTHRPESQDIPAEIQLKPTAPEAPSTPHRQRITTPPARFSFEGPSSQEMRRNISATSTSNSVTLNSPSRPPASNRAFDITRTPSGRRLSDSFITPLSRLATLTKTTPARARQRIKIDDASNTLSQFWRPQGFWNDLSDSDEEEDELETDNTASKTYVVRNTLGLPQQPIVLGPVGLAKRLGSFRRRKQAQIDQQDTTDRRSSMPSLQISAPMPSSAFDVTPTRKRRSLSLGPITHVYDAISQKRAERLEAQQEKRRQKLKQSIGPAILRDSARRL